MRFREFVNLTEEGRGGKSYYGPTYRAKEQMLTGTVGEWLDAMDISKDDLAAALVKVKTLSIFDDLQAAGFTYIPTTQKEKNGTLNFDSPNHERGSYQIFANGQIRRSSYGGKPGTPSSYSSGYQTRLKSIKPAMIHDNPVGTLVKIYTNAMNELYDKFNK